MTKPLASSITSLVSDDGRWISRRVFTDEDIYRHEKQRIFGRSWLYLAHESQLRNSGDFVTAFMGETPVIVARDNNGIIRVSINSCSHRGLPVCRIDAGNAKRFVCPYHNWAYDIDGSLVAIPQQRKTSCEADMSLLGLKAVPRVERYAGLIFGSFNRNIEALEDYLGDMRFYLDNYFGRFPGGVEVIGAPHKWRLQANWKLPVENQLGDVGHAPYLHATMIGDSPATTEIENFGFNVVPKPGHGAAIRLLPPQTPPEQLAWGMEGISSMHINPELQKYLLDIQRQVASRLGDIHSRIKGLTYGVYPNLSFLWSNSTLRVSHPRGPGNIEYWSWWVAPRDAADDIKIALRNNYNYFFGPAGLLEQEDSDAWQQQWQGSNIDYADDKPFYYGLGAGDETTHPDLPGVMGNCYNEYYARAFYQRWRADMLQEAES